MMCFGYVNVTLKNLTVLIGPVCRLSQVHGHGNRVDCKHFFSLFNMIMSSFLYCSGSNTICAYRLKISKNLLPINGKLVSIFTGYSKFKKFYTVINILST